MKIRWSHRAVGDLDAIFDFIAAENPTAAFRWIKRIQKRAKEASVMPQAGRIVPEFEQHEVREVFVR